MNSSFFQRWSLKSKMTLWGGFNHLLDVLAQREQALRLQASIEHGGKQGLLTGGQPFPRHDVDDDDDCAIRARASSASASKVSSVGRSLSHSIKEGTGPKRPRCSRAWA